MILFELYEMYVIIICFSSGDEVKNLVTGAVRGPGCLLDFTRIVKEYIEVLCKNNIQD